MYETLMDGDLALVTKFDYQNETPQRGDVVAVELGGNQGYVLRRVVGLPGETVEIVGGRNPDQRFQAVGILHRPGYL